MVRRALLGALGALVIAGCAATERPKRRDPHLIQTFVKRSSGRHGVPESLVLGVIAVESSFDSEACSHVGARGLMQLMPKTAASLARRLGWGDYEITDPEFNVEAGTYYLALLLRMFDGDQALALAAYNTGPARVRRWQRAGKALAGYSQRYVAAVRRAQRRYGEGASIPVATELHDQRGLRQLLRRQLYGPRPDAPLKLPPEGHSSAPMTGAVQAVQPVGGRVGTHAGSPATP